MEFELKLLSSDDASYSAYRQLRDHSPVHRYQDGDRSRS